MHYKNTLKQWLNETNLVKSRPRGSKGHHGDLHTDITNKNKASGGQLKWRRDINMADITVTEVKDPRLDFLQDYTLRSLRLKPDKWQRMIVSNEQMAFITGFVENGYPQVSLQYSAMFYLPLIVRYFCLMLFKDFNIRKGNWISLHYCVSLLYYILSMAPQFFNKNLQ